MAESEYQSTLDLEAKKRYKEKLVLKSEQIPDPYAVPQEEWVDDITKWPTVLYGDIYNYLIESKGRYTQQSLRAFKSLETSIILLVDMSEPSFTMNKQGRVRIVF